MKYWKFSEGVFPGFCDSEQFYCSITHHFTDARGDYCIGFDILFTEKDEEKLLDNHDEKVLQAFQEKMKRKREELDWVDTTTKVMKRFWNAFGAKDVHFVEMTYKVYNKNHRALFVVVEKAKKLVYIQSVRKEGNYDGSDQDILLRSCFSNAHEVKDYAMNRVVEEMEAEA